jgi:NAD(P)-dependent dehydrogenase (short-subunit alcohol dehydrogenase family)
MSERKVAVVTGASRGIGAAIASRLATDGARPVLVARSRDRLEELAAKLADSDPLVIATDLGDPDAIDSLVERIGAEVGRVDVLVNNAGVLPRARRIEKISREDWDATLGLNLTGPWQLTSALHKRMRHGSVVINIASPASVYPSVGLGAYNVSKAALAMLTRCFALEWARDGIRVVGVVPGKVDTEMVRPIVTYLEDHEMELNPLGRAGEPEEIAAFVSFLAGDEAALITGSLLPIDGGELTGGPAVTG